MSNFLISLTNLDGYHDCENENLASNVLIPILSESLNYDRAVGFFSSSSLIETATGLGEIYKRGGHIRLIMSPRITEEDADAIKKGYDERNVVEKALLRDFKDYDDLICKDRLNFLSNLISQGVLDIKIAVFKDNEYANHKMLHSKIGVCYDEEGNYISFEGSVNETDTGLINNFESLIVFNSWESTKIASQIKTRFDQMWSTKSNVLKFYDFPDALKKKLLQYQTNDFPIPSNDSVFEKKNTKIFEKTYEHIKNDDKPKCIDGLYEYQKQAINNWFHQRCIGIFNMATGSGKTYTAYAAMCKLLEKKNYHLPIIVICPYRHLVDQWLEDVDKFNIKNVIVGYSNPKYKDYKSNLKSMIFDYNDNILDYFLFITTIQSFRNDDLQGIISEIDGPILLVADEAHNLGSNQIKKVLDDRFKYRMALSATIDRHGDEEGTNFLHNYFGNECINFSLSDAIDAKSLCKYYYYPIITYLDNDAQVEYLRLTKELSNCFIKDKNGGTKFSTRGKILALKRARLIAGSNNKVLALKNEIQKVKDKYHMLIYCGTSNLEGDFGEEVRQIDYICEYLGKKLNMKIGRYTSLESPEQRNDLKKRFENGDDLQALVAIKCLDEGVNIPSIERAYILASSTNPREYIQRRGRVLRKSPNKKVAYIYDFVTLPMNANDLKTTVLDISSFKSLVKNEVNRMKEFTSEALNAGEGYKIIDDIMDDYGFFDFNSIDSFDFDWSDDDE